MTTHFKRRLALLATGALAAGALAAPAVADGPAVETVTEEDLGPSDRPDDFEEDGYEAPDYEWYTPTHDDPLNTEDATYGFVAAPDHEATYGNGSFLFDVPAGERSWILTDQYGTGEWHGESDAKEGTLLADITTLSYSTFISEELPDGATQDADVVPSLQIMATPWVGLVFDPPSDQAEVGEWQHWDATEHPGWRGGGLSDATWAEVVEEFDEHRIGWAIGIAAGTWPGKNFHGYTDLLTIGVEGEQATMYNFEPFTVAKDDCKDDGWDELGFKNQGQCIRYVQTGDDSR